MALPDSTISILAGLHNDSQLQGAFIVLFLYDYLLTFSEEVNYIWRKRHRRWNGYTILFILARYLPFVESVLLFLPLFVVDPSPRACLSFIIPRVCILVLGYISVECIFIVRTYAIWNKSRAVASSLLVSLAVTVGLMIFFLISFVDSFVFLETPSTVAFPGCFITTENKSIWYIYLFLLLFETLVLALTLYKVLAHRKISSSPLVEAMYRDGLTFYIYLFATSILLISVSNGFPTSLAPYLTGIPVFHRNIHAILSARLVMNVRKVAYQDEQRTRQELSTLRWAQASPGEAIELRGRHDVSIDEPSYEDSSTLFE